MFVRPVYMHVNNPYKINHYFRHFKQSHNYSYINFINVWVNISIMRTYCVKMQHFDRKNATIAPNGYFFDRRLNIYKYLTQI